MKLDLPTLAFILSLTCLTQVAALLVQYLVSRSQRGTGWWLLGSALMTLGFILLSLGSLPVLAIPVRVANPLLVAGRICLYIGVLRFMGRPESRVMVGACFLVFLGIYYHFMFHQISLVGRTITVSAAIGVFSLMTASVLLRKGNVPRSGSTRFTAAIFLAHGGFLALVVLYTLRAKPIVSFHDYAPIQVAAFVVPIITSTLWTFGFILMVNQRLGQENAEERENLQRIFNTGPDGALITRVKDGLVVDVNLGFLAMSGYTRAEVIGNTTQSLKVWHQPEERQSFLKQLQESGSCDNWECVFDRKDGESIFGLLSAKLITMNQAPHLISVVRDISARKRAEIERAELEAVNRQLQKAESLGLMAGSIAHHFNNKLQSVMANLELASSLPKGANPADYLASAKLSTERAAEVSRLLLVYLGQTSLAQEPRFLSEILNEGLHPIQKALPSKVTLETEYPSPGPVIRANADQIQQVLTNVVINACEAMGNAKGCIRLRLGTCLAVEIPTEHRFPVGWAAPGPDFAYLEVSDTGCGIAEADIEKLFDPFYSTRFTGRGLGLSVVLGLVQAHGGAITVASRQGQGSVFRIYFPVSTDGTPLLPEVVAHAPRQAGGKVLLVDDDEMVLGAIVALTEILGFTPLTARDGFEAVEVFRQHQGEIRCVITDLTMPRMDGWETLSALRRLEPGLPVILASGYDRAQVLAGTHADRPQSFLSKPFNLQELRDALGQVLVAGGSERL